MIIDFKKCIIDYKIKDVIEFIKFENVRMHFKTFGMRFTNKTLVGSSRSVNVVVFGKLKSISILKLIKIGLRQNPMKYCWSFFLYLIRSFIFLYNNI